MRKKVLGGGKHIQNFCESITCLHGLLRRQRHLCDLTAHVQIASSEEEAELSGIDLQLLAALCEHVGGSHFASLTSSSELEVA